MNRPQSIPSHYIETEPGVWVHPSRLPKVALQDAVGACEIRKQATNLRVQQTQPKPTKRIRQSTKPLLNKLEQEWFDYATAIYHERIMPQSLGFRLGNGVVYWPDFVSHSFTHAWEIKGRQPIQDDSVVKIKVAARLYPQIKWSLVWKEGGHWKDQIVLP